MNEEISNHLSQYLATAEGRQKLAAIMVSPFRCGGSGYDEDGRYYVIGGGRKIYRDSDEYRNLMARHYG